MIVRDLGGAAHGADDPVGGRTPAAPDEQQMRLGRQRGFGFVEGSFEFGHPAPPLAVLPRQLDGQEGPQRDGGEDEPHEQQQGIAGEAVVEVRQPGKALGSGGGGGRRQHGRRQRKTIPPSPARGRA